MENELVECPYNKAHRIMRKRFQIHLHRCREQHPDVELLKCPFNIMHLIPERDFVQHKISCPDRKIVTQYMYTENDIIREEAIEKHGPIETEENWDDDSEDVPVYIPPQFRKTGKGKSDEESSEKTDDNNDQNERHNPQRRSRSRSPISRHREYIDDDEQHYAAHSSSRRSGSQRQTFNRETLNASEATGSGSNSTRRSKSNAAQNKTSKYDLDNDPYYNGEESGNY